ncbi:MAG: hypothetical protein A3A27_02185 [Candidatus Wildermuthbacteria bacterium RIFCSPLOWO2_01_FULL_47_18]|uniref:Toxin YoeB n=1 Tax=Candidatus Wildermuthbacteria bacterium RIFCSPLOWO2_01_FULL_47_18 TaxID=1802460 RepID=A0A1G2RJ99_9BACT|nr:MAG: hypothetical protein A3A27_02185 [Candidatus Wildermuthbacteria bacterium RIFCSPLOWO2_01_FULL_47_18]OHB18148.1 MAG: hypothetical protein A2749_02805 [Parcubacteria group bacterium RIFCSPHIGHO2_01_FULL_45_26]
MEIFYTEEFNERYQKLTLALQKKAEKQERLFRANPFHPSLNTEKIEPKGKEVWTIRIDKKYRIALRFQGNKAIFLTCGPHDWIYRINF